MCQINISKRKFYQTMQYYKIVIYAAIVILCICALFIPINCEISAGLAKLSKVGFTACTIDTDAV